LPVRGERCQHAVSSNHINLPRCRIDKSLIVSVVSAAIAVIAAMAAGFQVVVMRRIAHGELTNEFLKIAGDDQIRAARSVVWGLRGKPLDDWTTEELGAAERAAATYDELGFLLLHSYIKSEPFLEFRGSADPVLLDT